MVIGAEIEIFDLLLLLATFEILLLLLVVISCGDELLKGLGFRSIGRALKVSHVSVFNWIKRYLYRFKKKLFLDLDCY